MIKFSPWIWSVVTLAGSVALAAQPAAPDAKTAPAAAAQASDRSVHNPAELQQLPVPTKQVPPQYPAELHEAGVEGSATLSFVVDTQGDVRDVRALHSTHPAFAEAATAAVEQWKFKPGLLNGQPVNTRMEIPIAFSLPKAGSKAVR